jgi:hypothetical protein
MSGPDYHSWTHRPQFLGGTDELPRIRVYVGTFVDVDDPGNDPPLTSDDSPDWQNGFGYQVGAPVWFAHGIDGELDMGGQYDLVTGSPVSGDVAFTMPLAWATTGPAASMIPIELDIDVWSIAIQTIDFVTGDVRVFWPIVADAAP